MFGIGNKEENSDKLNVRAYLVVSDETFKLAQKIWDENFRSARIDEQTHKEFLHFGYANPKCVAWLQRDQDRAGAFELIVRWEADKTHEVFALIPGQAAGNEQRAFALLNSMLTTPSVVSTEGKHDQA